MLGGGWAKKTRLLAFLGCLAFGVGGFGAPGDEAVHSVTKGELLAVMRRTKGYDRRATTNAVRFQTTTILGLARWARKAGIAPQSLFVPYGVWFQAFLEVNGLTPESASLAARRSFENKQDTYIEYGLGRVLDAGACKGEKPLFAVNVKLWWKPEPGRPETFSYIDDSSVPKLQVTNNRIIRYRILEYEDMIVCEDIRGLGGRPVSGLMGLMFRLLGDGRVVASRFGVAKDGTQVVWTRVRKGLIRKQLLVTVFPGGRAVKGVPPDRPDLGAIAKRLKNLNPPRSFRPFKD